jgi:hypothetical protein
LKKGHTLGLTFPTVMIEKPESHLKRGPVFPMKKNGAT